MNCHDARESLDTLLDGSIGLTERVPLELHLNMCPRCQEKLADLQHVREMQQRPAPRPIQWRPMLLAPGTVGRALWSMRLDDVAGRVRRLLSDKLPPRQLAVAAAVPLLVMLAVFVFERGFNVGEAMRRRLPSPSGTVTPDRTIPASPSTSAQAPNPLETSVARAPSPPPAAVKSTSGPPTMQKTMVADTKAAPVKPPQAKAVEPAGSTRSVSAAKPEEPAGGLPRTRGSAKPAAMPRPSEPAEPTRKAADSPSPTHASILAAVAEKRTGAVDVVGRLQVKSRTKAERDLTTLIARAGGTAVSRRSGPSVTVVEASVPQASYDKVAQGIARIGSWRLEAERSPLPELVQVSVRLAE